LYDNGIVDDKTYKSMVNDPSLAQVQDNPNDLHKWSINKSMQIMDAKDAMAYERPTANAKLSSDTSRQNALLGAQTAMRGQDFNNENNIADRTLNAARYGNDYNLDQQKLEFEKNKYLNPTTGNKAASEDERKAAGWLSQADNAYKNMLGVLSTDEKSASPGILESLAPEGMKGAFQGANRQKFTQATSSLPEALLRAATGAGVNKDEAAQKIKELTPQFWDDPEVKKQKLDSIPIYLESLKTRSGRAAPENYQVPTMPNDEQIKKNKITREELDQLRQMGVLK